MLEILSYKGVEFPNWMSKQQLAHLESLVEVKLINLKRCVALSSLGQIRVLKKLEIAQGNRFEFCCRNNLQCIETTEIIGCQELRCLPQDVQNLEHLSKMTINGCNNLTTLVALHSLKVLNTYACPVIENWRSLQGEKFQLCISY
ncbi:hypothetical protein ZIOFF_021392 [Zingiber officinale]|uniref:R13L1/DRL21-like LRR repeat region domain-containing protein n=1 Tax=Zingiber officinale TaxID=94328 RepID=A0A8J5HBQ5_ZINOF|nr:hypothetical protein ZIOFF_021392 [Zingiber officinale]